MHVGRIALCAGLSTIRANTEAENAVNHPKNVGVSIIHLALPFTLVSLSHIFSFDISLSFVLSRILTLERVPKRQTISAGLTMETGASMSRAMGNSCKLSVSTFMAQRIGANVSKEFQEFQEFQS